jgi:hypothetical protein
MQPQPSFADDLHSFIDEIAADVSCAIAGAAHESSGSASDAADYVPVGAEASSRDVALKRLLKPLIKNLPDTSQQPLAGLVMPSPPTFSTSHLALRNISGAYLVDAPCVSRPPPHFSISKSPLRTPRSLSPLARAVQRLSRASVTAAPSAAAAALTPAALPAILQQPIDDLRKAASVCNIEIQSTIDSLQTALVRVIVEVLAENDHVGHKGAGAARGSARSAPLKHDSSKISERSASAKMALEDFQDMGDMGTLPQIAAPPPEATERASRPVTQSTQATPTPRSFSEGYGYVYQLPLQSLQLSSSHQLLSREAAAEVAYKKRMAGKCAPQQRNSIASAMSASGLFDAPAAIWPSATLDSWPSGSSTRVATSFGDDSVNFMRREGAGGDAGDVAAVTPSHTPASKVEMLRQCSRRPIPQFLQKIEADLDAALIAKGLPVDASKDVTSASPGLPRLHDTSHSHLRSLIFLDALALLGAAFPTYRGLIARIHGELAACFSRLVSNADESASVSEKFQQIQLIHAEDLRRERERVLAAMDKDAAVKLQGAQSSVSQQRERTIALQASNAEFVAQRRVKELEAALGTASDTIARLQEAVVHLRNQVDSKSAEELQLQHSKAIAHFRSIIKESVHRDDYNAVLRQLQQLQAENAQLLQQLSAGPKTLNQADVSAADTANRWKVQKKNFGTQTFIDPASTGKYSLLEIKDTILSILPGLHGDIETVMAAFSGENCAGTAGSAAEGLTPAAQSRLASSPALSPSGSSPTSPVGKSRAVSFGSYVGNHADGANRDDDKAIFHKIFGLVKQSVDQLMLNTSRSSSPQTPGDHESKRLKSIHAVVKSIKSKGSRSEEDAEPDVPPSERELFAFFKTNGTGKNVPVHLRTNIKLVRNRFFSKRECENMVHQVWKGKVRLISDHNMCHQLIAATHCLSPRTNKRIQVLWTSFCCRFSFSSSAKSLWCTPWRVCNQFNL